MIQMGIQLEKGRREREKGREREIRQRGIQISKKPVREAGLRNLSIFIVRKSVLYFLLYIEING